MRSPFLHRIRDRRRSRGQSLVEFALVAPIMIIMLVAIVDLSRLYTTMMAVESAAREAADYGAFYTYNWETSPVDNRTLTEQEMVRRACVAASNLPDYADSNNDPADGCTNPTLVSIDLTEPPGVTDCSAVPREQEPCWVTVTLGYTFKLLAPLSINFFGTTLGIPNTLTFERSSTYALSDFEIREP
jgi:Flp pilus assembly protein TadG